MNPLKVISWAVIVCGLCSLVVVPVCAGGAPASVTNALTLPDGTRVVLPGVMVTKSSPSPPYIVVAHRAGANNTTANHYHDTSSTLTLDSQTCWLSDPAFVSPATWDYRLSTGSPCIDSGANPATFSGLESYLSVDLDGRARPRRGTDADIGSYEYYPN